MGKAKGISRLWRSALGWGDHGALGVGVAWILTRTQTHSAPPTLLPSLITRLSSTINDFFSKLQKATDKDPEGEEAIFAMIITATADFDIFLQMMRDAARNS